ncbi:uracil-DNA glycosylase [Fructobacillus sp. M2-14]|uniref:Uracil-DNA glycosylase n=1 Tax=Fructobacillus broussonetiae TaxID=2713173 RepID=A0ABS5QZ38_9LACO|nr:uracil-DNA glycosylase [Fructobacillus broussonetiae]MBS9338458.1 uracil-DNA glycosylase [Fructobacillus broussonetiae]
MASFSLTQSSWDQALGALLPADYQSRADAFLDQVYSEETPTYPERENVFKALQACPLEDCEVIILGQDPYHQPGQAQGLSFSVPDGMKTPPSLRNILQELGDDTGSIKLGQDLTPWAKQGVLLLNAVLTVKDSSANSHKGQIWEELTDAVIKAATADPRPKVFILWGKSAQAKKKFIDTGKDLVLESVHPSPLSAYRGFFGSKPFTAANAFLEKHGQRPIDWLR